MRKFNHKEIKPLHTSKQLNNQNKTLHVHNKQPQQNVQHLPKYKDRSQKPTSNSPQSNITKQQSKQNRANTRSSNQDIMNIQVRFSDTASDLISQT
jgi:hypothetical protein